MIPVDAKLICCCLRRVTLVEAAEVLGSFDARIREYAARKLHKQGVILIQGAVKSIGPTQMTLSNGQTLDYGLCVWSTGVGPTGVQPALHMPLCRRRPAAHT